jgi:hypothetical protein
LEFLGILNDIADMDKAIFTLIDRNEGGLKEYNFFTPECYLFFSLALHK